MKETVLIVGAGRVGIAIGTLLFRANQVVTAVISRTVESLAIAERYLPESKLIAIDNRDAIAHVLSQSNIVLITTSDDQIKSACDDIVKTGAINNQHTVIHCSGACDLSVLESARQSGARVASMHPIQTLASTELAIERLPGSYFGVTADADTIETIEMLVSLLNGNVLVIEDEHKAQYHAAACLASNYMITLVDASQQVYEAAGISDDINKNILLTLLKATLSNIEEVGTVDALTGPIARGDISVIKRHVESLQLNCPDIVDIYRVLGISTIAIALRKGTIDQEIANELLRLLSYA